MKTIVIISLLAVASIIMALGLMIEKPAVEFLKSLTQAQRNKTQMPFNDESKVLWHYIPSSMFPRAGIQLNELDSNQKSKLDELLKTFLSETGYTKTMKIIDLENILLEMSGDSIMRNPESYSVAFYGNPEKDSLWAFSFEGHHISLNFTIHDGKVENAPRFFGANPAKIPSGPREGERTLPKEEDLGFELINSLSEEQREMAIFQQDPFFDIVTGKSAEVEPLSPVGIMYGQLNRNQQLIFLKLLDEYLSTIPAEQAEKRMNSIKDEEINEVRFGWAGATVLGEGHYYRIQGKSFLIEFDNVQNEANHIHTVWRDFDRDFGRNLIREHYEKSHHHN
ncbi:DUF3500 domain-containing protein [Algoriphagus persicinus]|uniref:DUF3500 domain-containing protein n=1 Tax=Algoriphagus persicinus TaxID=3108754 RepID=UPI002B3C0743|nr:DUF3500 domain-containing protein [Algoriphagus sp. E1-3-M2]MEB2783027.1 DUF3500 domain-containing protein [Algoriphagus sp. E1-3-M2]